METRLIELETRLAFQEDTIQQLNSVLARQQQDILRLERAVEDLTAQLRALAPALVAQRGDETPPPHY
jgi:SlyX protein